MDDEKALLQKAAELFGRERADELRSDIQQMAREFQVLYDYSIGFEDEP